MAAKFGKGQKVKFTSTLDEQGCEKCQEFRQYVGKTGTIIDVSNAPRTDAENLVDARDMGEPAEHYFYAVQLGSEKLYPVLEECLVAAD